MRIIDIIQKKKEGKKHSEEEINFLINGYLEGTIEDYQMSAWLMAVCFNGLDFEETAILTNAFVESGDTLDFSSISDCVADKHSTGGVGDKVTLVLIPLLASCGIYCAKISGRGLGYTGGTIDKLESIPNFNCLLSEGKFKEQVKQIGAAITAQTPNLTPADGKIYALRDVTATVDNKSLICASVVSKKIASGANIVVLDVKYGAGAFIKTKEEAKELSELMIKVGEKLNKKISAVISSMEQPLGTHIGNSLEVIESIEFLKGNYQKDLYDIVLELASSVLISANKVKTKEEAKEMIDKNIKSSKALASLISIIEMQGGDSNVVVNYDIFDIGKNKYEIKSTISGYVSRLDALKIAHACKILGAGRDKKGDSIDFGAGCVLNKKMTDKVEKGETLLTLYYNSIEDAKVKDAVNSAFDAYKFSDTPVENFELIYN